MKVASQIIDEVVRRIVDYAHPVRIVLFGSAARGETNENSDLDLLIVMPDGANRLATAQGAHRALRGLGISKDILVVAREDLESLGSNPNLIYHTALTEGRELYHAP